MDSRRSDLEALQALSCAEELAHADSPVGLIGPSLGLPEPGGGPEAWAGFLIRWAQAIHAGCLDARALAAAVALAEERRLTFNEVEAVAVTIRAAMLQQGEDERRPVEKIERVLPRVANLVPASRAEAESLLPIAGVVARAELEEALPQPFRDAVAEAGGYAPKEIV